MLVDIHIHACAWSDDTLTLDDVAGWMKQHSVARSIVLQHAKSDPRSETEYRRMVATFARFRGIMDHYCTVPLDPLTTTRELVRRLAAHKMDGAIGYGEHYFGNDACDALPHMRLYEACAEVGFPILFHLGSGENGLASLEHAVQSHPACTFIAHAPGWWNAILTGDCDRLLQYPNVFADLSAGSGARAITRDPDFGRDFLIRNSDKLFFGTDAIFWSTQMPGTPPQFTLFDTLNLPASVCARIFHENAVNLLLKA